MGATKKIAVTGGAGQISYALLFRLASGQLYGPDTKVALRLLEVDVPEVVKALRGVGMELDDCGFGLLESVEFFTDASECFADIDCAFLVGARPRGKGMERKDLLEANASIFSAQGRALDQAASREVKVLVVGNPANTNCLIAQRNAPGLDPANFTAMTRLDQNRAVAQVAQHVGCPVADVARVVIWGNHSATQFPDIAHATVGSAKASDKVDAGWYKEQMIGIVQKRGAAIIEARGLSSAASAASAALDHMRDWIHGSAGAWVSMGVVSGGEYGIEEGLVYSYPCTCASGRWQVVPDLSCDEFATSMMKATEAELNEERDAVKHLFA